MPRSESQQVAAQRVWLAVIGKHPGWNDHLDDIGLDTERLVAVKRSLYVDGIGGVINAGAWEALSDEDRDEGFSHTFFWRQPDGMVIGRMWSSTDGKGRQKYPMIACAMCRSLPFSFVSGPLLERLRRLESQCRQVTTASEVIGATDKMRAELTELASFAPQLDDAPAAGGDAGPSAPRALIESGRLGEGGVGLRRVLYQMEREMSAYIRPEGSGTASRSRSVEVRGQHIRVPAPSGPVGSGDEHGAIGLWTRLLLNKVDPLVPVFLATKDGRDWVDIIVGELGPTPLACLQSTPNAIPFVSDIPFTIEGESAEAIDRLIESSRSGDLVERDPCYIDVPQDRLAPFLRTRSTESSKPTRDRKPVLLVLACLVVGALIVLALLLFGGGGSADDRSEPASPISGTDDDGVGRPAESAKEAAVHSEEPVPESSDTAGPVSDAIAGKPIDTVDEVEGLGPDGDRTESFRLWCALYGSWYLPFLEHLDTENLGGDPAFVQSLRARLASAEQLGDRLNPLVQTPGRYRHLDSLAASPPDAIQDPEFGSVLLAGLTPIMGARDALGPDRWAARRALDELEVFVNRERAQLPRDLAGLAESVDSTDGARSADAVARLAAISDDLASCMGALSRFSDSRAEVGTLQIHSLARAFGMLGVFSDSAEGHDWLGETERIAAQRASLADDLVEAARLGYPRVDPGLFGQRVGELDEFADEKQAGSYLAAWIEGANDASLYLLDPATDPRKSIAEQHRIDAVRESLDSLAASGTNAEVQELAGMLGSYESAEQELRGLPWNAATEQRVRETTAELVEMLVRITERADTETRRRAIEAERYIAGLNATDSITGTGSVSLDQAWVSARDDAIARYESDGDVVRLSRSIDEARARLLQVESSMPAPAVPAGLPPALTDELQDLIEREREVRILEAVLASREGSSKKRIDAYQVWLGDVRRGLEALRSLQGGIAGWIASGGDEDAASWVQSWETSWVSRQADLRRSAPETAQYLVALSSRNIGELVEIIRRSDQNPAAAFAAWQRIAGIHPAWGMEVEQLEIDRGLVSSLVAQLSRFSADDRVALDQRISETATRHWLNGALVADQSTFSGYAAIAEDLPIDWDSVPGGVEFNLFVEYLRRGLEQGGAFDRQELFARASTIRATLEAGTDAHGWLSGFIDEMTAREGREVDYRVIGPARAGWAVEPFDSGRVLRYTLTDSDEQRALMFRLVESPDAGVFYLSETEAPAWLLLDVALQGEYAEQIAASLPDDWDPIPDTRLGPRVWDWGRARGGRGIRLARTWVTRDRSEDRPYYPIGFEEQVGRPNENHPLQRISAQTAAILAATVGCRLPSGSEWQAARSAMGAPAPSADWNLRDQTFDTQRAHTVSLGVGLAVTWPDQQSFGDGDEAVPSGPEAECHAWSDGALWFVEVDAGRERAFRHLLGNVAEYVLPDLSESAFLTDRGDIPRLIAGLGSSSRSLPVIGGSALSPPSTHCDQMTAPGSDSGKLGYSDVGFRLAFTPGVEAPLVLVIGELVGDAPFLRMDG